MTVWETWNLLENAQVAVDDAELGIGDTLMRV